MNTHPMLQTLLDRRLAELAEKDPERAQILAGFMNASSPNPSPSSAPNVQSGAGEAALATAHAAAALRAAQDASARIVELEATVNAVLAELHNNTKLLRRVMAELGVTAD